MAWCPFATHRPLPENKTEPRIAARVAIAHSAAVNVSSLYNAFNRSGNNIESHFFIKWGGEIEQYMDTALQADANYKANDFAISVETEDDGDPNRQPWTDPQIDSLVRLFDWLSTTHKIKRQECDRWDGSGYGYHTMWGAPSQWTPVAKTCPGTIRKQQWKDKVLLRLLAPPEPQRTRKVSNMVMVDPGDGHVYMLDVDNKIIFRVSDPASFWGFSSMGIGAGAISKDQWEKLKALYGEPQ